MAAMPALAKKYSTATWEQYKYCPYTNPEVEQCTAGITTGGKSGGFFQLGKVEVPLIKPVTLQGGVVYRGVPEYLGLVAAANGGETLESPELPVRKGLRLITKEVQKNAEWPQALTESFNEAIQNKETGLDVKIEVAGNGLYENPEALSTANLLEGEGTVFQLPLKTKLTSPWLAKLGGGPCTVGNDEHPIMQDLVDEGAGSIGHLHLNEAFTQAEIEGSRLVDFNWPVEEASGATGCGGTYEQYVDRAIDLVSRDATSQHRGFTVLQGSLFIAERQAVQTAAEEGKL